MKLFRLLSRELILFVSSFSSGDGGMGGILGVAVNVADRRFDELGAAAAVLLSIVLPRVGPSTSSLFTVVSPLGGRAETMSR